MQFITRCTQCGDQNELGDDELSSIQLYFHKGTPNTLDRMVIYCENCGNKKELGISWPIDIHAPNKPVEPTASKAAPVYKKHGCGVWCSCEDCMP